MKRTTIATFFAVLTLCLAGCTDSLDAAGNTAASGDSTVQQSTEDALVETPEPLVADPSGLDDVDQRFLDYVRSELLPETQIRDASDESLIDAGHRACEQVLSGVALEDVRVVEGETPAVSGYYMDSLTIRNGAQVAYCPATL